MKKTIILASILLLMSIGIVSADDGWTKQEAMIHGQDMIWYSSCGKSQYGDFISDVLTTKDNKMVEWELFSCSTCTSGQCTQKIDATILGTPLLRAANLRFF